jgi:hypothetical protein
MTKIRWDGTADEFRATIAIARRVIDYTRSGSVLELSMDILACHLNACPLNLDEMMKGDLQDVVHDVAGISAHIDRVTGALRDCFIPRFAAKSSVGHDFTRLARGQHQARGTR